MNEKQQHYLNILEEIAKSHGGKYISGEYINNRTYLEWQCSVGHTWKAAGNKIQQGGWCPNCIGRYRTIQYVQNIAKKHGGEVLDTDFHGMKDKYSWRCKHKHEWKSQLKSVVHLNQWCPYCSGNARLTLEEMHKLALSKNGKCLSTSYSNEGCHLLWECSCGYQWKSTPKNIKKGKWCPKCSGNISPTINDAIELAISRNGKLLSTSVRLASDQLEWQCDKDHVWQATWSNVKNKKSWCPHCVNFRHEEECRDIFESIFDKSFSKDRKVLNCQLELDGYCEDLKLAFEYNGEQHYKRHFLWHRKTGSFKKQQARDIKKAQLCEERGIRLIVIPYTEQHRLEEFIRDQLSNSV